MTTARPITRAKAYRLAIQAIKLRIQNLAFDANMHEKLGADYPLAVRASKERRELKEAIAVLEQEAKKETV